MKCKHDVMCIVHLNRNRNPILGYNEVFITTREVGLIPTVDDDDKGGDNVKDDDHDDYRIIMTMMKVNILFLQDLLNHLLIMSSLTEQVLKSFIEN